MDLNTSLLATGSLSVLNVGAGDIEVRFNPHQPEEVERALKMLKDMQRRGYAILVKQGDGSYARAIEIDEKTSCYVISEEVPVETAAPPDVEAAAAADEPPVAPRRRGRPPKKQQPIAGSHAVGVARSAGG